MWHLVDDTGEKEETMLIIGEKKYKGPYYAIIKTRTKHGLETFTSKLGIPRLCGVLFLGGDGSDAFWCLDEKWSAAVLKLYKEKAASQPVQPFASDAEAKDYIAKHGNKEPNFENCQDPNNWIIYPEDQWRSI